MSKRLHEVAAALPYGGEVGWSGFGQWILKHPIHGTAEAATYEEAIGIAQQWSIASDGREADSTAKALEALRARLPANGCVARYAQHLPNGVVIDGYDIRIGKRTYRVRTLSDAEAVIQEWEAGHVVSR